MTTSRATLLALLAPLGLCGCGVDLDAVAPTSLAATDPGLIQSASAIIFTWSSTGGCDAVVDASAAELDDLIAAEPNPSIQRIPMLRGRVDVDRDGSFEDADVEHTFGAVPSNVPVSFIALAVDRDPGRDFTLADLSGSIFAVACRSLTPTPGKHHGLPLVLAPAGLR